MDAKERLRAIARGAAKKEEHTDAAVTELDSQLSELPDAVKGGSTDGATQPYKASTVVSGDLINDEGFEDTEPDREDVLADDLTQLREKAAGIAIAVDQAPESVEENARRTREFGQFQDNWRREGLWSNAVVLVAVPCSWTHIARPVVRNLRALILSSQAAWYDTSNSQGIASMRNSCVRAFLDGYEGQNGPGQFSHLFMADADMLYPPHTLKQLVRDDKDIVAGLACSRHPDPKVREATGKVYYPNTFSMKADGDNYIFHSVTQMPPHGLHQCGRVSMGGILIKREVLEQMPPPWFDEGERQRMSSGKITRVGEDIYFFAKAAKCGFEVWCDTTLPYGHLIEAAVYPAQTVEGVPGHTIRSISEGVGYAYH